MTNAFDEMIARSIFRVRHHQTKSGSKPMAIPHAQPGELIDVRPLADTMASSKTRTLIKTPHVEVIRIILPAGKVIADHKAPREITVQCIEGRIVFKTMGKEKPGRGARIPSILSVPHAFHHHPNGSLPRPDRPPLPVKTFQAAP